MTIFNGTPGNDTFDGTNGDDTFNMQSGGVDTVDGAGGDDTFVFKHAYADNDTITGGNGADVLQLKGEYVFTEIQLLNTTGIEEVTLAAGHNYHFSLEDGNVASVGTLTISGAKLTPGDELTCYGTQVTSGSLKIVGGAGNDDIRGGALSDILYGGLGQDHLEGEVGASGVSSGDRFVYKSTAESTVAAPDHLFWDPGTGDVIDLKKIDADVNAGGNQRFDFIGTAAFTDVAGQLRYESASGGYLVSGDVNGDGVADFAIQTFGDTQSLPGILVAGDFIL